MEWTCGHAAECETLLIRDGSNLLVISIKLCEFIKIYTLLIEVMLNMMGMLYQHYFLAFSAVL